MTMASRKRPEHHLEISDPVLGAAIRGIKLKQRRREINHFRSLARAILGQQISTKAADSIAARFCALFPGVDFPNPAQVLKIRATKLRTAGVSGQKAAYLKDLSRAIVSGALDFEKISAGADEEVIAALTQVKGIGRWTAEMFLMFSLNRPDIFSAGDLGLQNAIKKLYKLRQHPDKKKLEKISAAWKPHRTLAARYLWASLENKDVVE
jgi:DNA-3-methyladenine glycosylase II